MRLLGLTLLACGVMPCLVVCGGSAIAATDAGASRVDVTVAVDPSNKHPISPYIYGINNASIIDDLPIALTLDRAGGNRATAYNWETNASNAGKDYLYQNDSSASSSSEPAAAVSALIAKDQKIGM